MNINIDIDSLLTPAAASIEDKSMRKYAEVGESTAPLGNIAEDEKEEGGEDGEGPGPKMKLASAASTAGMSSSSSSSSEDGEEAEEEEEVGGEVDSPTTTSAEAIRRSFEKSGRICTLRRPLNKKLLVISASQIKFSKFNSTFF